MLFYAIGWKGLDGTTDKLSFILNDVKNKRKAMKREEVFGQDATFQQFIDDIYNKLKASESSSSKHKGFAAVLDPLIEDPYAVLMGLVSPELQVMRKPESSFRQFVGTESHELLKRQLEERNGRFITEALAKLKSDERDAAASGIYFKLEQVSKINDGLGLEYAQQCYRAQLKEVGAYLLSLYTSFQATFDRFDQRTGTEELESRLWAAAKSLKAIESLERIWREHLFTDDAQMDEEFTAFACNFGDACKSLVKDFVNSRKVIVKKTAASFKAKGNVGSDRAVGIENALNAVANISLVRRVFAGVNADGTATALEQSLIELNGIFYDRLTKLLQALESSDIKAVVGINENLVTLVGQEKSGGYDDFGWGVKYEQTRTELAECVTKSVAQLRELLSIVDPGVLHIPLDQVSFCRETYFLANELGGIERAVAFFGAECAGICGTLDSDIDAFAAAFESRITSTLTNLHNEDDTLEDEVKALGNVLTAIESISTLADFGNESTFSGPIAVKFQGASTAVKSALQRYLVHIFSRADAILIHDFVEALSSEIEVSKYLEVARCVTLLKVADQGVGVVSGAHVYDGQYSKISDLLATHAAHNSTLLRDAYQRDEGMQFLRVVQVSNHARHLIRYVFIDSKLDDLHEALKMVDMRTEHIVDSCVETFALWNTRTDYELFINTLLLDRCKRSSSDIVGKKCICAETSFVSMVESVCAVNLSRLARNLGALEAAFNEKKESPTWGPSDGGVYEKTIGELVSLFRELSSRIKDGQKLLHDVLTKDDDFSKHVDSYVSTDPRAILAKGRIGVGELCRSFNDTMVKPACDQSSSKLQECKTYGSISDKLMVLDEFHEIDPDFRALREMCDKIAEKYISDAKTHIMRAFEREDYEQLAALLVAIEDPGFLTEIYDAPASPGDGLKISLPACVVKYLEKCKAVLKDAASSVSGSRRKLENIVEPLSKLKCIRTSLRDNAELKELKVCLCKSLPDEDIDTIQDDAVEMISDDINAISPYTSDVEMVELFSDAQGEEPQGAGNSVSTSGGGRAGGDKLKDEYVEDRDPTIDNLSLDKAEQAIAEAEASLKHVSEKIMERVALEKLVSTFGSKVKHVDDVLKNIEKTFKNLNVADAPNEFRLNMQWIEAIPLNKLIPALRRAFSGLQEDRRNQYTVLVESVQKNFKEQVLNQIEAIKAEAGSDTGVGMDGNRFLESELPELLQTLIYRKEAGKEEKFEFHGDLEKAMKECQDFLKKLASTNEKLNAANEEEIRLQKIEEERQKKIAANKRRDHIAKAQETVEERKQRYEDAKQRCDFFRDLVKKLNDEQKLRPKAALLAKVYKNMNGMIKDLSQHITKDNEVGYVVQILPMFYDSWEVFFEALEGSNKSTLKSLVQTYQYYYEEFQGLQRFERQLVEPEKYVVTDSHSFGTTLVISGAGKDSLLNGTYTRVGTTEVFSKKGQASSWFLGSEAQPACFLYRSPARSDRSWFIAVGEDMMRGQKGLFISTRKGQDPTKLRWLAWNGYGWIHSPQTIVYAQGQRKKVPARYKNVAVCDLAGNPRSDIDNLFNLAQTSMQTESDRLLYVGSLPISDHMSRLLQNTGIDLLWSMLSHDLANSMLPFKWGKKSSSGVKVAQTHAWRQSIKCLATVTNALERVQKTRLTLRDWAQIKELLVVDTKFQSVVDILRQALKDNTFGASMEIEPDFSGREDAELCEDFNAREENARLKSAIANLDELGHLEDQVKKYFEECIDDVNNPFSTEPNLHNNSILSKHEYFSNLAEKYEAIRQGAKMIEGKDAYADRAFTSVEHQLQNIANELKTTTNFPPSDDAIFRNLANLFQILGAFQEKFSSESSGRLQKQAGDMHVKSLDHLQDLLSKFVTESEHRMEEKRREKRNDEMYAQLADDLVRLQRVSRLLPGRLSEFSEQQIGQLLLALKKSPGGNKHIGGLGFLLNTRRDPDARYLLKKQRILKGYATYLRNTETEQYTIKEVLADLKHDNEKGEMVSLPSGMTKNLKEHESKYQKLWETAVEGCVDEMSTVDGGEASKCAVVKKTKERIISDAQKIAAAKSESSDDIVNLVALVSAYWTIDSSSLFPKEAEASYAKGSGVFLSGGEAMPPASGAAEAEVEDEEESPEEAGLSEAEKKKRRKMMYVFPHAAQIVAIFRLFGIDEGDGEKMNMRRQLIEVKTGEGKSVTLAISSIVLGLLGYDVSVACFSAYLSERDAADFQALFFAFQVDECIKVRVWPMPCLVSHACSL